MSVIPPSELSSMDYAYQGEPYVEVAVGSGIELESMDYAFRALPFVAPASATTVVDPLGMAGFFGI